MGYYFKVFSHIYGYYLSSRKIVIKIDIYTSLDFHFTHELISDKYLFS